VIIFQGTVARRTGELDKFVNFWCGIFSGFQVTTRTHQEMR